MSTSVYEVESKKKLVFIRAAAIIAPWPLAGLLYASGVGLLVHDFMTEHFASMGVALLVMLVMFVLWLISMFLVASREVVLIVLGSLVFFVAMSPMIGMMAFEASK